MTNATVYYDNSSDPLNPGWVCETDEGQFQMEADDPEATDEELMAEGRSFADGDITVRR